MVRPCPWWLAWGNLDNGGNCGLAHVNLNNGLWSSNWNIVGGAND